MTAAPYEAARAISTATLCESGARALPSAIRPQTAASALCGRAFTISSPPGDNLWIHRALAVAGSGDVLVVDVGGATEHGYWGEILAVAAIARGIAGLVIDGGIRDIDRLDALGFPAFARGLCIRGTTKRPDGNGTLGAPVVLGDATIEAGDLIRGDRDGLVVVPAHEVEAVLATALARDRKEAGIIDRLRTGETTLSIYGWE